MFTKSMHERLSEWFNNVSVLMLATLVLPFFQKAGKVTLWDLSWGLVLMAVSLWFSLRLARKSGRGSL